MTYYCYVSPDVEILGNCTKCSTISNKNKLESNRTRRHKCRNMKKKIQMDRSHIKKREWRDTKGCPTLEPSGKQEERKTEK